MRILIIDDREDMRKIMGRLFKSKGYDIYLHTSATGAEALMRACAADLLLTDHDLGPHSDTGLSLAKRMKKKGRKVIIMSGNFDAQDEAVLYDIPFYLKSDPIENLFSMIEEEVNGQGTAKRVSAVQGL